MRGDKKLTLYTWIYRWESPLEFEIRTPRAEVYYQRRDV